MTQQLFINASVLTRNGLISNGWLHVIDGKIKSYGAGSPPEAPPAATLDARGLILAPGFIDIHVHGARNYDTMDASIEGLQTMAAFYASKGVTGFLPTTWTDSRERIYAAMRAVKEAQSARIAGAKILGVHMEGPYLNVDYTGAQNPAYIRRADRDEMAKLFDLDVIRLVAVAPEFEENHWLIETCRQRGIQVSVAHSAASYEQMMQGIALGIGQSTHTYNAMTGLHHRKPGIVGAVLTTPDLYCELIADTIHVHPAAMKVLWLTKGADHVILITDAIRASGMPNGEYPVDERVMIVQDGECRLPDGTLAGSIITMNRAVANFMKAVDLPFEAIWKATSLNAARSIGVANQKGSIERGKDADLILIDDAVNIHMTMVEGQVVYSTLHDLSPVE